MNIHNYWALPVEEQDEIRTAADCETDEEHQAFLNALFPAYETFEEADQVLNLSDTDASDIG